MLENGILVPELFSVSGTVFVSLLWIPVSSSWTPFSEPMCPTTLVMKVFRNATREGRGPLSDNHVKS